jgi:hypothetical protein
MKREQLTIRTVNKRSGFLPDDTRNRWLLLLRRDAKTGECKERQIFHCNSCEPMTVSSFTHYAILPNWLRA